MHMNKARDGFTLIEISTVIVVIGLIIGGIMVGNTLVRASHLQAITVDISRYKNALKLFQDKYKYLPGDMPNATSFWSGASNGDGDGNIGSSNTVINTPVSITTTPTEPLLAWQHLAYAALIPGTYSGTGTTQVPGTNIPASKLNSTNGYTLFYASSVATTGVFPSNYHHIIVYGGATGQAYTAPTDLAGLSGDDAHVIDQKIDDGMPGTGNVLSYTNAGTSPTPNCANGATATATYITGSSATCSLIFITGF